MEVTYTLSHDAMEKLHDSLAMLRASLYADELKVNQSQYITEIYHQLKTATINQGE